MKLFIFFSPNFDRFKWKYLLVKNVVDAKQAWIEVSKKTKWPVADLKEVCKIWLELDLPEQGEVIVHDAQPAR